MSVGRIYSAPNYFRVYKPLIAAKLAEVEVDFDPNFKYLEDNSKPEFLEKFPTGQIPAFESKDGSLKLVESTAIALHFANLGKDEKFRGSTIEEKALINQFIFHAETQLLPAALGITLPFLSFGNYPKYDEKTHIMHMEKFKKSMAYLDKVLDGKTYLVGDRVTIADVIVVFDLETAYRYYCDKQFRDSYPNVTRYFLNFHALEKVKEAVEKRELCTVTPKP